MIFLIQFAKHSGRSIFITFVFLWSVSIAADYTFNQLKPSPFWTPEEVADNRTRE
jgi:hypothetical protein